MATNTPPPSPDDDRIERLLRELAGDHIADDGFTARTLRALPKRRPRRALILGAATVFSSAIALPLAAPTALELLESAAANAAMALEQQPVLPAYVSLALGLLLVAFTTLKVLVRTR